jgi:23S rRNA (adenine2503-C2)-methyltransferase
MRVTKEVKSPLNKLFVFETEDGYEVEAVFYKGERLCISTQVGCPVKCAFCASGRHGLFRNLSFEEIKAQYELLKGKLPIKGVALAGIGEPSLNVESVSRAVEFFKNEGLKVTVSTTGYPLKNFKQLIELPHNGLTLSVHAVSEEKRKELFGLRENLNELLEAIEEHLSTSSSSRRKRFQLGYLLIKGINDSKEELKALAEIAKRHRFTVMLMAFNKVEGVNLSPVSKEEYENAFKFLRSFGVRVTLSNRFRTDKLGGCGTLTVGKRRVQ